MRKRTLSREIALKVLYAMDISQESMEECLRKYWENNESVDPAVTGFAEELVRGVKDRFDEINRIISRYADNWDMRRMAVVDRNVLRIAAYELLCCFDTPPKVAINEAIDIAKKYGDKESGKFVNGILDRINKTERCDARQGADDVQ